MVITDMIRAISWEISLIKDALIRNVMYEVNKVHSKTIKALTTLRLLTKMKVPLFSALSIILSFVVLNSSSFFKSS